MINWTQRFISLAKEIATWSKDPRRKIGCVVIDNDRRQLSGGYNGFPRKVHDTEERLNNKELKNKLIVHAEANAIAAAARTVLLGSTIFITQRPCTQCAALVIQAGIARVVVNFQSDGVYTEDTVADHTLARDILLEAGVIYEEV